MKKILKNILILFLFFLSINTAYADQGDVMIRLDKVAGVAKYAPANTNTLARLIGNIIQYILSFLGVIFLVLLVYAGFLWMTAQGESDQVTKAKDIMINAIVGLVIVLMSYAITFYVVDKLSSTTLNNQSSAPTNQYSTTP